jgi:hypothetical protein
MHLDYGYKTVKHQPCILSNMFRQENSCIQLEGRKGNPRLSM